MTGALRGLLRSGGVRQTRVLGCVHRWMLFSLVVADACGRSLPAVKVTWFFNSSCSWMNSCRKVHARLSPAAHAPFPLDGFTAIIGVGDGRADYLSHGWSLRIRVYN